MFCSAVERTCLLTRSDVMGSECISMDVRLSRVMGRWWHKDVSSLSMKWYGKIHKHLGKHWNICSNPQNLWIHDECGIIHKIRGNSHKHFGKSIELLGYLNIIWRNPNIISLLTLRICRKPYHFGKTTKIIWEIQNSGKIHKHLGKSKQNMGEIHQNLGKFIKLWGIRKKIWLNPKSYFIIFVYWGNPMSNRIRIPKHNWIYSQSSLIT